MYDVVVQVSDGKLVDTQAIAVKVVNVNDTLMITSNGGLDSATVSIPENSTFVTKVTVIDVNPNAKLVYSIVSNDGHGENEGSGIDFKAFTIDSSGNVRFIKAPNFELPADHAHNNTYFVPVRVSDGASFDIQTIKVVVTDVVEKAANKIVTGGLGNDILKGDTGDDIITGGKGTDTLSGGGGHDTFIFKATTDAGDRILDFTKGKGVESDLLNLHDVFAGVNGYNAASALKGGFVQMITSGADTLVQIDMNGSVGGTNWVTLATLVGVVNVDYANIMF